MCAVIRAGRTVASGAPGFVSRCRTTSAEWHIMSLSTPPPCRLAAPEPRHVRPAVLFRGAREVGPSRRRRAARPEQLASQFRPAARRPGSRDSRARSRCASRDRATFFASATLRASGFSQAMPASVPFPLSIACTISSTFSMRAWFGPGEPDRVDRRIGDHVGDRRVRLRRADVEVARELRGRRGVLLVRAPDAEHVGVAHGAKCLEVKARVEAAADERDAESLCSRPVAFVLASSSLLGLTLVCMTS